jgi:hypothetical protein
MTRRRQNEGTGMSKTTEATVFSVAPVFLAAVAILSLIMISPGLLAGEVKEEGFGAALSNLFEPVASPAQGMALKPHVVQAQPVDQGRFDRRDSQH